MPVEYKPGKQQEAEKQQGISVLPCHSTSSFLPGLASASLTSVLYGAAAGRSIDFLPVAESCGRPGQADYLSVTGRENSPLG